MWHVAASLEKLREQLNALAPKRSKASDGGVGDSLHASRDSDHNPWYRDTVTARDFTHDPAHGLDCNWLAQQLTTNGDLRIKYVIWNRRIWEHGKWAPYDGANPHKKHLHLSVVAAPACESKTAWKLTKTKPAKVVPASASKHPTLQRGDAGPAVELIQRFLGVVEKGEPGYGTFGPATEAAVRKYQSMRGLEPDAVVGPLTWQHTGL